MESLSTSRRNQILALLAVAQLMGVLDFSIVNVALPSIQRMFHLAPADLQWVVSAYALVFGGFLLLGGRAADLFDRKRVFMLGWGCSRWLPWPEGWLPRRWSSWGPEPCRD